MSYPLIISELVGGTSGGYSVWELRIVECQTPCGPFNLISNTVFLSGHVVSTPTGTLFPNLSLPPQLFFTAVGIEPRAVFMKGECFINELHPPPLLNFFILKQGLGTVLRLTLNMQPSCFGLRSGGITFQILLLSYTTHHSTSLQISLPKLHSVSSIAPLLHPHFCLKSSL